MRRALDTTDRESFVGWLDALSAALADASGAAVDAVRSRRERTLSRAELGRQLTDAHDRIAVLLDAARRGLGPILQSAPGTADATNATDDPADDPPSR